MRKGGSGPKGAGQERKICRQLSHWVSSGKSELCFWRSATSGARATVQFKKGIVNKAQAGDITSLDPMGDKLTKHFLLECKFYKNLELNSLIFGTPKTDSILEFWLRQLEDSKKFDKEPFLIAKQNKKLTLLGVTSIGIKKLNQRIIEHPKYYGLKAHYPSLDLYLFDFEALLKQLPFRETNLAD